MTVRSLEALLPGPACSGAKYCMAEGYPVCHAAVAGVLGVTGFSMTCLNAPEPASKAPAFTAALNSRRSMTPSLLVSMRLKRAVPNPTCATCGEAATGIRCMVPCKCPGDGPTLIGLGCRAGDIEGGRLEDAGICLPGTPTLEDPDVYAAIIVIGLIGAPTLATPDG